jgi:5-formyltetrahydrofolate cyclo-ligase
MDKNTLRQEIRERRKTLSFTERKKYSSKIIKQFEGLAAFKKAHTILVYVSMPEEVNTHALIQKYLKKKRIVIPRVLKHENCLALCWLKQWESLQEAHFGILEIPPEHPDTEYVKEKDIDLAVVPGTVFDETGHRIGYGRGYYDRVLKKIKGPKIGLAYECQRVEKIPAESHDVQVDQLVTEQKIYSFKQAPHAR